METTEREPPFPQPPTQPLILTAPLVQKGIAMPMQLTISRNRKQSENYNSQGYGVSLTIELDQSLLTRPGDLQHAIHR